MIAALLVSWAGASAADAAGAAVRRAREVAAGEMGGVVRARAIAPSATLLTSTTPGADLDLYEDPAAGRMGLVLSTTADTVTGRDLDARSIAARGVDVLGDVVPPFSACWTTGHGASIWATTDDCAMAPRHVWQGDGWAALSTSSVLLATAAGTEVYEEAIATCALLGYHIGPQTWYRGVRKLQGAELVELHAGQANVTPRRRRAQPCLHDATDQRTVPLQGAVKVALDRHPDAGIELSGGMDCRAVLAAIPVDRRRGMAAMTLGAPDSADVAVAGRLAERFGLRHHVIDIRPLGRLDPADALALATTAGRRRDFGRDATGAAVLDWVEQRAEQHARFTGQGGEFLRGHYYRGQPREAAPTRQLVDRLTGWRFVTAGAADPALFAPTFLETARRDTTDRMWRALDGFQGDWLSASDELYLRVRMQRWAGSEYSAAALRRPVLAPYFHPDVLEWGRGADVEHKRDGRALNGLVVDLDPTLARMPLDVGLRPIDLAAPSWRTRAVLTAGAAGKAAGKVRRRLGGAGRAPVGASTIAGLVTRAWAATPGSLARVAELPCMDAGAVAEVATGRRSVSPLSVAFLLGLDGALAASVT